MSESKNNNILSILKKSLTSYLKNSQGIGSFEILRRQRDMTGENGNGNFTSLSEAFNTAVKDREKLRSK